ncbi:hypothetical protein [Kitasatospora sp. NPDC057198]|uniref:hypothetical protein n=1 Tax=Kitasatospora sp. NPDC057198 TaxID=3346046 RepID=UPI0036344886
MVQAMKTLSDRMLGKLLKEETAEASGCQQVSYYCSNHVYYQRTYTSWNCAAPPVVTDTPIGSC